MFVLAIDQSTTSTKALLFNEEGRIVARAASEHRQYYPKPGWVEHDPVEIMENVYETAGKIFEKTNVKPDLVKALAITNQRETTVLWKRNGIPVYRAVVWQCQRGKEICEQVKKSGFTEEIKKRTGLIIDPYFSASKILWILDNVEDVRKEAEHGEVLFGTIDSWIIWNLTNGETHATDFSNASRTLLLNIQSLSWDETALEAFNIPEKILPKLLPSNACYGTTDLKGILPNKVPIIGVMGDSSAALFGQGGFEPGKTKATYGTGTSVMMNIGTNPIITGSGILTSIGWQIDGETTYVLEGNIHSTGDTLNWLIKDLGIISTPEETEKIALSLDDNGGVYFVPAFSGLGAPYWDNDASATITGIRKGINKNHIIRAALEATAYQVRDLLDAMKSVSNIEIKELRADGGGTKNSFLMQFQSDILGIPVKVSEIEENSARGVAFLALVQLGKINVQKIKKLTQRGKIYSPSISEALREQYYKAWKLAVSKVLTKSER